MADPRKENSSHANGNYGRSVAGYGHEQLNQSVNSIKSCTLTFASELRKRDIAAYDSVVVQLAQEMSRDGRQELLRLLRSPKAPAGILQPRPMRPEVVAAMRQRLEEDR